MKKTTRNILIMLAVLLVLGGAAAALFLWPEGGEPEEVSSDPSEVSSLSQTVLVDRAATEVASVSVENKEGSFRFLPGPNATETTADFVLDTYQGYDVNTTLVTSCVKNLTSFTSVKDMGEQKDLENFGLAGEDAVRVTLEYKDGKKEELVLGREGGETAGRYVLKDGAVYIVSGVNTSLYGSAFDFFNKEVWSISDRTEAKDMGDGNTSVETVEDRFGSVVLSGSHFPDPVEIRYEGSRFSEYEIVSPFLADSGSEKFLNIADDLKTLTADGVVAVRLTDDVLEQYGLNDPFAKMEFTLNGQAHTVAVSAKNEDGGRYLMADENDVVYHIAADKVASWAEASLMDLRMSYVWMPNIKEVSQVKMTVNGSETYTYDVDRQVDEENSTEEETAYTFTVKNAGGSDIAYENYQAFYKRLIFLTVLSVDPAQYSGTPAFKVEYSFFDSQKKDTVEYYTVGEDRYAAVLNGSYNGLVRKGDLDKVTALLPDLDAGSAIEKKT